MNSQDKPPRGQWLDRILQKRGVSEDGRAEVQMILNQPLTWLKGEYLPFQKLKPWELFLFFLNGFFGVASGGWDGRDKLYRYTYKVNANMISVSDIIANIWDGLNDPLIGSWMDRNPMKDSTYRWIYRVSSVSSMVMTFLYMLDLGLTPVQRIILFTGGRMLSDILGTMSQVADTKYAAGITASSNERGKYQIWWHVGRIMGTPFGGISDLIRGFTRDRLAWNDYRLFTRGYAIAFPLMVFQVVIRTFARNRVKFDEKAELLKADHDTGGDAEAQEHTLTMRESFGVLRHNKFMIYGTIAGVVTSLTPSMDLYPLWRHMLPVRKVPILGETRGEGQKILADVLGGIPSVAVYPFLSMFTKRLGGPKRVLIIKNTVDVASNAVRYLFGYHSVAGLAAYSITGFFTSLMGPADDYANHVLKYEMLDYVEYKTGVRSEGVTMAFQAFLDKIVKNSVDSVTGNAFQAWTGINDININEEGAAELIPERYRKWAWTMAHVTGVVDGLIWLWARAAFPYDPSQKDVIETELRERRKLAEQMKGALEEKAEPTA